MRSLPMTECAPQFQMRIQLCGVARSLLLACRWHGFVPAQNVGNSLGQSGTFPNLVRERRDPRMFDLRRAFTVRDRNQDDRTSETSLVGCFRDELLAARP